MAHRPIRTNQLTLPHPSRHRTLQAHPSTPHLPSLVRLSTLLMTISPCLKTRRYPIWRSALLILVVEIGRLQRAIPKSNPNRGSALTLFPERNTWFFEMCCRGRLEVCSEARILTRFPPCGNWNAQLYTVKGVCDSIWWYSILSRASCLKDEILCAVSSRTGSSSARHDECQRVPRWPQWAP